MTVALVFAMSGGAYAAHKYLITSTKQISPKVLSQLKGKTGATGPQGPAGSAGAQGPEGKLGKEGTLGKEGKEGTPGKAGLEGKEGSPWTAGGTLPSGKTLKGDWNASGNASAAEQTMSNSVSYGLPLSVGPTIHYIRVGEGENEEESKWAPSILAHKCQGSALEPGAAPGNLCVFAKLEANSKSLVSGVIPFPTVCSWEIGTEGECDFGQELTGGRYGFGIEALSNGSGPVAVIGTWAVTAR